MTTLEHCSMNFLPRVYPIYCQKYNIAQNRISHTYN